MSRFTFTHTDHLRSLREAIGLTQKQAAQYFHLSDRETIAAWETGQSAPRESQRRAALITYLLDRLNLRRRPQQFLTLWHELMVMEWQWQALSEWEIARHLPALPLGAISVGHNLPAQPNALIDRAHDISRVSQLLMQWEGRLLTLHGPPGVGKTRLGLAVAANVQEQFANGVYFVPLAPVTTREGLLATLIDVIGMREASASESVLRSALVEFLRRRHTLLLLDNFEQVMAAAPVIAELLTGCPWLRILITSRSALNMRFEQRYALLPLAQADAIALFVQRAQAVNPDFALNKSNSATVAQICQQLDGLPLAIELMAARIDTLSPAMMLHGLQRCGLDLLNASPSDAPARHQTMRNAIAHSVALLTADERQFFYTLGVFVGGCTQEAATMIHQVTLTTPLPTPAQAATTPALLTSLLHKNLLMVRPTDEQQPRFYLLETVRQYASEQLLASAAADSVCCRHAHYFCEQAEIAQPHLTSQAQKRWITQLDCEQHNCEAALRWAIEQQDVELALRLVGALWPYWEWRCHYRTAISQLRQVLQLATAADAVEAHTKQQTSLLAQAQLGLAAMELWSGDLGEAQQQLAQSWAMVAPLPATLLTARIRHYQAIFAARCGDYAQADHLLTQIADTLSTLSDLLPAVYRWERAHLHEQQAQNAFYQADLTRCTEWASQARADYLYLGDQLREAATIHLLGCAALYAARLAEAEVLLTKSLTTFADLGEVEEQLTTCFELGCLALQRNDLSTARQRFRHWLTHTLHHGNGQRLYYPFWGLARYALAQRQPSLAARLLGMVHACLQRVTHVLPPIYQPIYQQNLLATKSCLGDELFTALFTEGSTMTPLQAVEETLRLL